MRLRTLLILLLLTAPVALACNGRLTFTAPSTILRGSTLHSTLTYTPESSAGVINGSGVVLGVTLLGNGTLATSEGDNLSFSFTPKSGPLRLLAYAVEPGGCTLTKVLALVVVEPPPTSPPPGRLALLEGRPARFTLLTNLTPAWFLDEQLVARDTTFLYRPGFNDAGEHRLVVRGPLGTLARWNLTVSNKNRPPFQVTRFLDVTLPLNTPFPVNLSLYFFDPDQEVLRYNLSFHPVAGAKEARFNTTWEGSLLTLTPTTLGKAFVTYSATDPAGARAESEQVSYTVIDAPLRTTTTGCGDGVCIAPENCTTCEKDCGTCEECVPRWECGPWSACEYPGVRTRNCTLLTTCSGPEPPHSEWCAYTPRCDDGVRNGDETGVDCGGACPPCPTCNDTIKNQGETGIDCGGPCAPCPTCNDTVQNQGESDVDCGGPCAPCPDGASCNSFADCANKRCVNNTCVGASCKDGILNRDEEGVDCGGSFCAPCPTCKDGVQNGWESGVDCGGPCAPCPTCNDTIKNQGETLPDCGGPCKACTLSDYAPLLLKGGAALLLLVLLVLLRLLFSSRTLFLARHGKLLHAFYEDLLLYCVVRWWNALARPFRPRRGWRETVSAAVRDLTALRAHPSLPAIAARLRRLYATLFALPENFSFEMLLYTIRKSRLPFTLKVIVLRNTKLLALMELSKLYTDAGFALEDVLRALRELERAVK